MTTGSRVMMTEWGDNEIRTNTYYDWSVLGVGHYDLIGKLCCCLTLGPATVAG